MGYDHRPDIFARIGLSDKVLEPQIGLSDLSPNLLIFFPERILYD